MKSFKSIYDLEGETICTVAFVCDYVEFYFGWDFPILRCIANPVVIISANEVHFPNAGSRDALCETIGHTIDVINVDKLTNMQIVLDNKCKIVIPLNEPDLYSGESVHFVPHRGGEVEVW